ncbi:3',5'-bisphosphate nucleotidase AHL-like [Rutidosis leptorrhynchoides]|uniref:3',5'-bisphosphate nucleotidase AHL-like n=1 Tax=Rutidosis leptorrhynchoides TaxID=125765 RepID=UPI003A99495E
MTVFRSNLGNKFPQILVSSNKNNTLLKTHLRFLVSFHNLNYPKFNNPICCHSNFDQKTQFYEEMEKKSNWVGIESGPDDKYCKELEIAVKAVHVASLLCQKVQQNLIFNGNEDVQAKDDNSPVTIADWSVQATVSWILSEAFGPENISIVAEEDIEALSKPNANSLLSSVVTTVNDSLSSASSFGIQPPVKFLETPEVLEAISRCNSTGGPTGRFWVLDPVDGTLGFVRGDQYAIALALVENGEVVLGVLGCPNYPMNKEWLNYQNGYRRILSRLSKSNSESWDSKGCVLYAKKGSKKAWMQPLLSEDKSFIWPNNARAITVSDIDNPVLATFCEPVEKANSSHSFTQGLAHSVGLRNQPLRVYSMVKYAAIARGDAEIFMKFARAGYKEKIWDHAAGVVIIEEAGGVVTDAGGRKLDFSKGMYLQGLDRGIIACAGSTLHEKIMRAVDASWNSSSL